MTLSLFTDPFLSTDLFGEPFLDPFLGDWTVGTPRRRGGRSMNAFQREVQMLGSCDIGETKDAHIVSVDAPGLTPSDVKVRIEGNMLTITGERKRANEEKTDRLHRVERSFGKFTRSFELPSNVDVSRITANVDNGVIRVAIPKMPEAQPRIADIPVSSGMAAQTGGDMGSSAQSQESGAGMNASSAQMGADSSPAQATGGEGSQAQAAPMESA